VFAGLLSEWTALIGVFIVGGLILKSVKSNSLLHGLLAAIVSIGVLLAHPETWAMLMGITFVYLILQTLHYFRRRDKLSSQTLKLTALTFAMMSAINIASLLLRNYVLSSTSKIEAYDLIMKNLSFKNLTMYWSIVYYYMVGSLLNPLLVFLSLVGALAIFSRDNQIKILVEAWIVASVIPFLMGDRLIQSRIIYNLPLSIFAAQGLYSLLWLLKDSSEPKRNDRLLALIAVTVILVGVNYALRMMFMYSSLDFPSLNPPR
jgi:hypothetical protein